MMDMDEFITKVREKGLEPKEIFQEAVKVKFAEDEVMIESWKVLWAFCMFRGKIPNFIVEYFQSLK